MAVELRDISAERWQDTGGIPIAAVIKNFEMLAAAVNARALESNYFGYGTVQIAMDAPGIYPVIAPRIHPQMKVTHVFAQLGSTAGQKAEVKVVLNGIGPDLIVPAEFKKTEGRGKVHIGALIDADRVIGPGDSVDVIYEGSRMIIVSVNFAPVGV